METATRKSFHILLIEDNPADQEIAKRAMDQIGLPHSLHIVEDGREALDYLLHRRAYNSKLDAPSPDLILLDLNLPKIDGKQVLKEIQENRKLRLIPVIVLSTSDHDKDIVDSYEVGAKSYIQKPMNFGEFTDLISILNEYWLNIVLLPGGRKH